jgi:hypothetical protein
LPGRLVTARDASGWRYIRKSRRIGHRCGSWYIGAHDCEEIEV